MMLERRSLADTLPPTLTEKQRRVHELVARRRTTKQIARDLDISASRVSQYIRVLKTKFGVETLAELADFYRVEGPPPPCNVLPWEENHLPSSPPTVQFESTADEEMLVFQDGSGFIPRPPWEDLQQFRVGPGALDGPGATARRFGVIVAVAVGLPVAVIVTLSAMMSLSDLLRSIS